MLALLFALLLFKPSEKATLGPADPRSLTAIRIQHVRQFVKVFKTKTGRLPVSPSELRMILSQTQAESLWDGWERQFLFFTNSDHTLTIESLGADGLPGGTCSNVDFILHVH